MRPLLLLLALAAVAAQAQRPADPSPHSDARLVADASRVAPGDAVEVALEITVEDGWHIYWVNPGDSGQPVAVDWTLPPGAEAGPLRFPPPALYEEAGIATYAHGGTPSFLTRVEVPDDARGEVSVTADARWLICSDICLPARQTVALAIPVGPTVRTGALDAALDALPDPADGWTASAALAEGGYALTLDPPDGVSLDGATFFVDQKGVLDHGAAQSFAAEGGAWAAVLAASPYADGPASELTGVLVAGDRAVELAVPVSGVAAAAASAPTSSLTVWTALAFAFVGGVILNLMPCVFPILSIKILGFVRGREQSAAALRTHGLVFGAGVVVSFLALAAVLLALKATGDGAGWGFQLRYPPVVAGLAALMTVLALNLLGVFEVGQGVASVGGRMDRREGLSGAFLSGVLAVVVASPCTAPFMGGALGFAVVQPAPVALGVFGALGVGMALPYVVLSFQPQWLKKLPRPGPWMETLKHVLAFPLLATAVWLVWLFGQLLDLDAAALLLLALVAVGLAAWAWGRSGGYRTSARSRLAARTVALASALGAVALVGTAMAPAQDEWMPFDAETVAALVADGEPVFVDVTASWCLSCQVNKQTTLTTDAVRQAFDAAGVTTVRADWTDQDPAISAFLDRFGRTGVPLYVFYPGGGAEPVLLPEVLTPGIVMDALAATAPETAAR
ncbi:protein-disulfide reductase DsbD family protein [Rubrivirga sp.]|uniref:protein-disulfide reductase DsbD family protein n=1 Tax=Rubrivirga sp. TaxID=1885344 RepID=UPI003B528809